MGYLGEQLGEDEVSTPCHASRHHACNRNSPYSCLCLAGGPSDSQAHSHMYVECSIRSARESSMLLCHRNAVLSATLMLS